MLLVGSSHVGASSRLITIGLRWWTCAGAPMACLVTMTSRAGRRSFGFRHHRIATPVTDSSLGRTTCVPRRAPGCVPRSIQASTGAIPRLTCADSWNVRLRSAVSARVAQQLASGQPFRLESPRDDRGFGAVFPGDDREGRFARAVLAWLEQASSVELRPEFLRHSAHRPRLNHSTAHAVTLPRCSPLRAVCSESSQGPGALCSFPIALGFIALASPVAPVPVPVYRAHRVARRRSEDVEMQGW